MSTANETPEARCPKCLGLNGVHGSLHRRFPAGGGGTNEPCPLTPVQPPAPDPDETCPDCHGADGIIACWSPGGPCPAGRTVCETCGPCNHCTPVPPATTGGTDEAEGLAAWLDCWQRDHEVYGLMVCREMAADLLASSWLRERDLARDARTRADAWDEGYVQSSLAHDHIPPGADLSCYGPPTHGPHANPYRADREATR